jgi:hypothetical protein
LMTRMIDSSDSCLLFGGIHAYLLRLIRKDLLRSSIRKRSSE